MKMKKIGLLGCGNIASIIAKHKTGVEIVTVFDAVPKQINSLVNTLAEVKPHLTFKEFIN